MEGVLGPVLRELAGRPLAAVDPAATPGFAGDKATASAALRTLGGELAGLQERLFAAGRTSSDAPSVVVLLQGMDTSGKGGTVRDVAGLLDPQGTSVVSFAAPTAVEREHDFLWRVQRRLPAPGRVAFFDRSHYEDVLVARVRRLAPAAEIERRYAAIVDFERAVVGGGGVLVKCLLHISLDEQAERLAARLADPTKYWKYDPRDLDEREAWDEYLEAYDLVLQRTSTDRAPWHVVPADRKWYRSWAVATLLTEALRALDLSWPAATFDVAAEQARLARLTQQDPAR